MAKIDETYNLNTIKFSNIYASIFGHSANDPNQFYTNYYHRHDTCLQFVISGEGEFFTNNHLYPVKKNTLFLIPKTEYHYYQSSKTNPYDYFWVHLNGSGVNSFLEYIGISEQTPIIYDVDNPKIEEIFWKFKDQAQNSDQTASLLLLSQVYELLYEIAKGVNRKRTDSFTNTHPTIKLITDYVAENYSQNITLDDLAELCHNNKCYLSTFFKQQTGISPIKYLIQYRISQACKLLLENYSVSQTAELTGFNDLSNFLLRFKQNTGITPSEFKKTHSINILNGNLNI